MSRRQETRRRRERRMVARRREGGKEGVGVFSCSRRIARQHRLSRSCRRACNGGLTGFTALNMNQIPKHSTYI